MDRSDIPCVVCSKLFERHLSLSEIRRSNVYTSTGLSWTSDKCKNVGSEIHGLKAAVLVFIMEEMMQEVYDRDARKNNVETIDVPAT